METSQIKTLSLVERYNTLRKVNPALDLIHKIMSVTGRSEITVRMWISAEKTPPRPLARLIADALDTPVDVLFPKLSVSSNKTI